MLHRPPQRILIPQVERRIQNLAEVPAHLQRVHRIMITTVGDDDLGSSLAELVANIPPQESTGSEYGGNNAIEAASASSTPT